MPDDPRPTDPEARGLAEIARQVEDAIRSGRADAELEASEEARQAAIESIIRAERIDPRKRHRPMTF